MWDPMGPASSPTWDTLTACGQHLDELWRTVTVGDFTSLQPSAVFQSTYVAIRATSTSLFTWTRAGDSR